MNLTVTEEAAQWYVKELDIEKNASLRFYVRYGGVGGLIPGFSLGIKLEEPEEPIVETTVEPIRFFVESTDEWYFSDQSLRVEHSSKWDEPEFIYE